MTEFNLRSASWRSGFRGEGTRGVSGILFRPRRSRLIPPKASAWLDLNAPQTKGEAVDAKNIRKHANDVMRLSQLFAPELRIPLATRISDDLNRFLNGIEADRSIDPKSLKLNNTVAEIVERIALAYALTRAGTR